MSKKKTIAVAIVLALILLIGGMLAYFTDTDTAENKFTLGNVDIEITETWDEDDGKNVVPGQVITKAPSVTNQEGSASAYVFVEVVVPCFVNDSDELVPLFTFTANSGWALIKTTAADTTTKLVKYVYGYGSDTTMTPLAAEATTSTAVFSNVTVASTLTQDDISELPTTNIVINAKGIQSEGLPSGSTPAQIYELN